MAITISSSPSLSEQTLKNLSKKSQHFESKEARRQARQERKTEKESAKSGSSQLPPPTSPSPDPSFLTGSPSPDTSSITIPEAGKSKKRELADLRGARVVNFATQGTKEGSNFSVFASGKGPGAIDTEKKEEEEKASVNTVA